jgi:hypothetical protein
MESNLKCIDKGELASTFIPSPIEWGSIVVIFNLINVKLWFNNLNWYYEMFEENKLLNYQIYVFLLYSYEGPMFFVPQIFIHIFIML